MCQAPDTLQMGPMSPGHVPVSCAQTTWFTNYISSRLYLAVCLTEHTVVNDKTFHRCLKQETAKKNLSSPRDSLAV